MKKDIQTIIKDVWKWAHPKSLQAERIVSSYLDNQLETYDNSCAEFVDKHNYNYAMGIPYPWDAMTQLTGGLRPGLHVIASRPSVGKTSFVLQCLSYWCQAGYHVAYVCLDMSVTEMIKRPVANLSRVSPTRTDFGWADEAEKARFAEAATRVKQWCVDGLFSITLQADVDKLRTWAERRRMAGKLDILVIDFAQRLRIKSSHGASEYETVTYASGVLKQLANECLLPVILLSQLSRDNVKDPNGKRPPELSDLRGSSALEQDATTVVLLHKVAEVIAAWKIDPPLYYIEQTADPRLNDERAKAVAAVSWNLAKNQNGPTGEIPFVVFQDWFRWYVGNDVEMKAEKYHRIMADWRFLEEPFKTAEQNGAVVYPMFWPQKCAEVCGKLGYEIPSHIRVQLSKWDIERYEKLLKDRETK